MKNLETMYLLHVTFDYQLYFLLGTFMQHLFCSDERNEIEKKRFFSFDQLFILIGKSSITYFISGSKCISLRLLDIFHYIFSTLQINPNNMFISSILK